MNGKYMSAVVSLCSMCMVSFHLPVLAEKGEGEAGVCGSGPKEFRKIPTGWKWTSDREAVFTYDGTYADSGAFAFDAVAGKARTGVTAPERYDGFPIHPKGAVNMTWSPDSTMIAFTRDNDLYVAHAEDGREVRLTSDGSALILNGYASWVYYEEIFGRQTDYRAFWWSPDGSRIGFYRFDNTGVPLFPIYSPSGQDGSLKKTSISALRSGAATATGCSCPGCRGSRIPWTCIGWMRPTVQKSTYIMRSIPHGWTGSGA